MIYLPPEIIDIIADYRDYDKYCKPKHKENLNNVINDIQNMSEIMTTINPVIVWNCWGPGSKHIENYYNLYDDSDEDYYDY